jgi:aminoglycoside phosphotransferase (APT) family kinase protein
LGGEKLKEKTMNDNNEDMNATEKFTGTMDVQDKLKFPEIKLEEYLSDTIPNFKKPLQVKEFKGGQSNPTYQLITPNKKYVLRRKPPGKLLPSAHAVDREYKVITALNSINYAVPETFCLCEDESIIGTIFYVMEMVEGRIIWDPTIPNSSQETRKEIFSAKNKTLAELHNIDYEKIGLADFGRPGNYFARQISRWTKQYLASETQEIKSMQSLIEWLPNNIPGKDETSIVHGDYRIDNMVLHPTETQVLAVLDWELSTLGHPLGDFTYHLMQWFMPDVANGAGTQSLSNADLNALGIPSADEYIRMYCEQTNRNEIENIDYYLAYNFFRLAGILQGIIGRLRDGTAASEHAEAQSDRVRPLADAGWEYAKKAGAI